MARRATDEQAERAMNHRTQRSMHAAWIEHNAFWIEMYRTSPKLRVRAANQFLRNVYHMRRLRTEWPGQWSKLP